MRRFEKATFTLLSVAAISALGAGVTDGTFLEMVFGTLCLSSLGFFVVAVTMLIWKN